MHFPILTSLLVLGGSLVTSALPTLNERTIDTEGNFKSRYHALQTALTARVAYEFGRRIDGGAVNFSLDVTQAQDADLCEELETFYFPALQSGKIVADRERDANIRTVYKECSDPETRGQTINSLTNSLWGLFDHDGKIDEVLDNHAIAVKVDMLERLLDLANDMVAKKELHWTPYQISILDAHNMGRNLIAQVKAGESYQKYAASHHRVD